MITNPGHESPALKRVCVFCGSSSGARDSYRQAAVELGQALVKRKIGLVYGGGCVGLMGTVADAVLEAGGEVIGVIPKALVEKEVAHKGLPDLRIVETMHERKALMASLSDGFIALPGGLGTMEEFCEVLTWGQLGIHQKPCGLLNVDGFYNRFLLFLDHAVDEEFVRPQHRAFVLHDTSPLSLIDTMCSYKPPTVQKWINREQV